MLGFCLVYELVHVRKTNQHKVWLFVDSWEREYSPLSIHSILSFFSSISMSYLSSYFCRWPAAAGGAGPDWGASPTSLSRPPPYSPSGSGWCRKANQNCYATINALALYRRDYPLLKLVSMASSRASANSTETFKRWKYDGKIIRELWQQPV